MKKPPGAVKLVPHRWMQLKRLPWPVCRGCGLVRLRNKPTEKAVRRGHWLYEDERE